MDCQRNGAGNHAEQTTEQRVGRQHGQQRQSAPEQGVAGADIAPQIVFDMGIVPELFAEYLLHKHSGGIFQHGGHKHPAQKEEKGP